MSRAPLVVVGDVLLDREVIGTVERLCPEAPVPVLDQAEVLDRPGGAGLAALFTAAATAEITAEVDADAAREVVLVAAISADAAGDRIRELVIRAGIRLVEVPLLGPTPEKIRLRAGEHLLMRLDRGSAASDLGPVSAEAVSAIHDAGAILVSDYGRGVTANSRLRAALAERARTVPVVWDPHPRGGHPVAATRLVVPNRSEAARFVDSKLGGAHSGEWLQATAPYRIGNGDGRHHHNGNGGNGNGNNGNGNGNGGNSNNGNGRNGGNNGNGHGGHNGHSGLDAATADVARTAGMAVRLRRYWGVNAVAVTIAERGAVLSDGVRAPSLVPTPFSARGDSCGAGDRFASTAVVSLSEGAPVLDAVTAGVTAATAYVAAGGVLALRPELHEPSSEPEIVTTSRKS